MGTIASNGIINLMRGDTFTTPIYVNLGSKLSPRYYKLGPADKLYFGLMEPNQAFEDAILKKVFDHTSPQDSEGNTLLMLKPTDTEKLVVGQYYYMIKLRTIDMFGQESVRTIVNPTIFWLNGNNVKQEEEPYYEKGHYEIDRVILDGGEIKLPDNFQGV
jgi:hypothetical protein